MKRTPFRSELLGTGVEAHIAKFEKKGAMRKVVRTVVRAPGGGRRLRVVDSALCASTPVVRSGAIPRGQNAPQAKPDAA